MLTMYNYITFVYLSNLKKKCNEFIITILRVFPSKLDIQTFKERSIKFLSLTYLNLIFFKFLTV